MRHTATTAVALALLVTLGVAGCSASGTDEASTLVSDGGAAAPEAAQFSSENLADSDVGTLSAAPERSVITTGWVTIVVTDPTDATAEAIRITEQVGGRLDGRQEYAPIDGQAGSSTLTLRIPSDALTATLEKFEKLGEQREVSISASDVTMEVQDLAARTSALAASIARLQNLMDTATDIDALIQLETAISDRQAQLESMESQQRYLSDQVSMSTITLNLMTEADAPPPAEPGTFLDGLAAGWKAFLSFFAGLVVVIGVLLPWLIFLGIIAAAVILIVRARRRARVSRPVPTPAPGPVEGPPLTEHPTTTPTDPLP